MATKLVKAQNLVVGNVVLWESPDGIVQGRIHAIEERAAGVRTIRIEPVGSHFRMLNADDKVDVVLARKTMSRTASNVGASGSSFSSCVCLIVAVGFALVASPAFAQNSNQSTWDVYGAGNLTCGKWLLARESKNEMQVELIKQWVAGWIVSYNYYLTEKTGKGRVSTPDFDTITAYVDRFCADKPLTPVALAPAQMVQELGGAVAFHNRRRTR